LASSSDVVLRLGFLAGVAWSGGDCLDLRFPWAFFGADPVPGRPPIDVKYSSISTLESLWQHSQPYAYDQASYDSACVLIQVLLRLPSVLAIFETFPFYQYPGSLPRCGQL